MQTAKKRPSSWLNTQNATWIETAALWFVTRYQGKERRRKNQWQQNKPVSCSVSLLLLPAACLSVWPHGVTTSLTEAPQYSPTRLTASARSPLGIFQPNTRSFSHIAQIEAGFRHTGLLQQSISLKVSWSEEEICACANDCRHVIDSSWDSVKHVLSTLY